MCSRQQILFVSLFAFASSALADLHLSPQQCNEYPFKPAATVTQRGLHRELAELEAVGYRPYSSDVYYPDDIQKAERKLRAVYRRDCKAHITSPVGSAAQ